MSAKKKGFGTGPGNARSSKPDRLIQLIAEVLAGTQVPRSIGALGAATKPWDELRKELKLFGYPLAFEIETRLRCELQMEQLPPGA